MSVEKPEVPIWLMAPETNVHVFRFSPPQAVCDLEYELLFRTRLETMQTARGLRFNYNVVPFGEWPGAIDGYIVNVLATGLQPNRERIDVTVSSAICDAFCVKSRLREIQPERTPRSA